MSFASPFPEVVIPECSLYEYVFGDLDETDADRVALVDVADGTELTYAELVRRVDAFAGTLAQRGIGVGDVVALLSPNSAAFAVAFHGTLAAGATLTTINAMYNADEIASQLHDSRPKLFITAARLLAEAVNGAAAADLYDLEVLVVECDNAVPTSGSRPLLDFDPATRVAVLPYSSGTTGKPKGVMLTHRNLVANVAQMQSLTRMGPQETLIAVVPFFHSYGMTTQLCSALRARCRLVIMPAFDLGEFLINIQKYRCTQANIAPPVAVALAKHPMVGSFDLSSLHTLTSAAAPLDEELAQAVAQRLGCRVVQAYGMTELSPGSHMVPPDGGSGLLNMVAPLSSCGWTLPNAESKLIDIDSGAEIPLPLEGLSESGELCFRGPNVMAGYFGNAAATAATIDPEGFLHTGDLVRVDVSGCIYIVDRLKELIKYKGYQVPPAELEALLLTHPCIADTAVVGVIDTDTGEEVPKAFVVTQPGAALSAEEITDFVAGKVAPYKKIRQVEFIDMIPKSSTGKILRKVLRTQ
jgi:acyl-CoA synthetase (AMP-forming)/AMP-acid ligase II